MVQRYLDMAKLNLMYKWLKFGKSDLIQHLQFLDGETEAENKELSSLHQ